MELNLSTILCQKDEVIQQFYGTLPSMVNAFIKQNITLNQQVPG